jgi:hypothetical protein
MRFRRIKDDGFVSHEQGLVELDYYRTSRGKGHFLPENFLSSLSLSGGSINLRGVRERKSTKDLPVVWNGTGFGISKITCLSTLMQQ